MFKVSENQIFLHTFEKNEQAPLLNCYFSRYQNGKAHILFTQQAHSKNLSYRGSQMAKNGNNINTHQ